MGGHAAWLATLCGTALLGVALGTAPALAEAREPLRLDAALGLPERLTLRFEHRFRYELLDGQFRPLPNATDDILVLRTLVHGRLRLLDGLTIGAELQDSRALLGEDQGLIGTTIVNPVELLRAYAELARDDVLGGRLEGRLGRITMDVGSRRLVARNRYRNTINAFTGIDAEWRWEGDASLRAFWVLPVRRLPVRSNALRSNQIVFDEERPNRQFWGLAGSGSLPASLVGELQLFGLHEDDRETIPTRNRQLVTPAFRVFRRPAPGALDLELETALQFGRSRATLASTQDLDHFAHFHHVEVGYTFDTLATPRIALEYDYASGDEDPSDGENGRFDTLFGARRFDFGPTGIYGPFARANLHTPGLRVRATPHARLDGFFAFRSFWLAAKRDAWVTTGLRDVDGSSGRYVGSQLELRLRGRLLPGNLVLEGGYAHLFAGEFMDDAPLSPARGDADYIYVQVAIAY